MDRLKQIRDLGRSLGYEEAELRDFVTERERIERQVRFEEREDKRIAYERETQRLVLEAEREDKRLALEGLALEAERQAKTLADEMEYRKEEMKLKFDLEISRTAKITSTVM